MGCVYRAQHEPTERVVALKILNKELALDADKVRRFAVEARLLSKLNHANVVKVFTCGTSDEGVWFIAMEELVGQTLEARLVASGKLAPEFIARMARQLLYGLEHAHAASVIHRDLKPANIMLVEPDDTAKIMDFGIAKLLPAVVPGEAVVGANITRAGITGSGGIIGSPAYMSPEQCRGAAVDERTDLYALGCIMYECLTGAPPFVDESALGVMCKHVNDAVPPFAERGADEKTSILQAVIWRCLAKEPAKRFASAAQMQRALSEQDITRITLVAGAYTRRWPPALVAGVAILTLVCVALVTFQAEYPAPWKGSPEASDYHDEIANSSLKSSAGWFEEADAALGPALGLDVSDPRREQAIRLAESCITNAVTVARQRLNLDVDERRQIDARAAYMVGKIHRARRQEDQAEAALQRAIRLCRSCLPPAMDLDLAAHLELLRLYVNDGEGDRALMLGSALLDRIKKSYPGAPPTVRSDIFLEMVRAAGLAKHYDEGVAYAEEILRIEAETAPPQRRIQTLPHVCRAYMDAGLYDKALPLINDWLDCARFLGLDGAEARLSIASCYASAGQCNKGLAMVEDVVRTARLRADHTLLYASLDSLWLMYRHCQKAEKAEAVLREIIDLARQDNLYVRLAERWNNYCLNLLAQPDYARAEAASRQAIAEIQSAVEANHHWTDKDLTVLYSSLSACRLFLSRALAGQKHYEQAVPEAAAAVGELEKAPKLNQDLYYSCICTLADLHERQEDFAAAQKDYEQLIAKGKGMLDKHPDKRTRIYSACALVARKAGDHETAVKYRRLAADRPEKVAKP